MAMAMAGQRRPLVRLAAFGSALRQRERKRFCGEVEKCLRHLVEMIRNAGFWWLIMVDL